MAVFGVAPDFVRISLRLLGADVTAGALPAAALLRRTAALRRDLTPGDPRLAVWREPYLALGVPPDTPPPPAVLAAWAATPGGIPSQGPLPDLVHAFALQHAVPAMCHDLGAATGNLWLRPSRGLELYLPVGGRAAETPAVGELILADDADQVLARHWHGAQGRPFVLTAATQQVHVHVDLLPPRSAEAQSLAAALTRLLTGFVGGAAETQFLTRARPQAVWSP